MKLPQPRCIYVDVDGTLVVDGQPNKKLIAFLKGKKAQGYVIHLWSSQGSGHCERTASALGLIDLFYRFLDKPALIVDDQGLKWLKYVQIASETLRAHVSR